MLNYKLSKLLYFLSENSRITTKELGKLLRISQQSASYSINNFSKKKIVLNYQTLIDPAKFGLVNVIVLYNYINFDKNVINNFKKFLKINKHITRIEEVSQGADLLVEYSVPNLSLFNKQNRDFLMEFPKAIRMNEIYVVIVKHKYDRKYLIKKPKTNQIVISGDRDIVRLSESQKKVLNSLRNNSKETILNIATKSKLNPKTVLKIKKDLEKQKIIRKYTTNLNPNKIEITRNHILIQLDYDDAREITKFLEYIKNHKNIISAIKIIGNYELLITTEKFNHEKSIITSLRKNFKISNYKIIESDSIIKKTYLPDNTFTN